MHRPTLVENGDCFLKQILVHSVSSAREIVLYFDIVMNIFRSEGNTIIDEVLEWNENIDTTERLVSIEYLLEQHRGKE